MPISAVQQFMLGTVLNNEGQAHRTLKAIADAGYSGIELCGFMIRKTPFVVKVLTRLFGMPIGKGGSLDWPALIEYSGLDVVGLHEDLGTLQKETDTVIATAKRLRTKYVVITGFYRFDFSDKAAVSKLATDLNRVGKRLKEDGIELLYHNHNCELRRVEPKKTAYSMLIEETDPDYVNFEFDSYWLTEAGANALSLMRSLGDRVRLYHINDRGTRISGPSITPILKSDSMELGDGNIDLLPLVEQAKRVNVDAVILESHRNWLHKSPLESLRRSAIFLEQNLCGEVFERSGKE
jgi:sugar phosphate isomerase/epimerase